MKFTRRKFLTLSAVTLAGLGLGAFSWNKRWHYIVIHHSAGEYGNIEFLQKVHRERQAGDPIDAIPYHFIIGNGNGMGDGEIASDWRKDYDIWGAHVSGNNSERNFLGLGICLIGNFEKRAPTSDQYASLLNLTKSLMDQYSIPISNVSGHGHTPGESTKCPGRHFPMRKLISELS